MDYNSFGRLLKKLKQSGKNCKKHVRINSELGELHLIFPSSRIPHILRLHKLYDKLPTRQKQSEVAQQLLNGAYDISVLESSRLYQSSGVRELIEENASLLTVLIYGQIGECDAKKQKSHIDANYILRYQNSNDFHYLFIKKISKKNDCNKYMPMSYFCSRKKYNLAFKKIKSNIITE